MLVCPLPYIMIFMPICGPPSLFLLGNLLEPPNISSSFLPYCFSGLSCWTLFVFVFVCPPTWPWCLTSWVFLSLSLGSFLLVFHPCLIFLLRYGNYFHLSCPHPLDLYFLCIPPLFYWGLYEALCVLLLHAFFVHLGYVFKEVYE
jgi:hypothetical protein